ncbi:hypothetical protein [Hymenobacter properus]|uniref:Uncharacterized protein n=1 Tax=Hymenobacter properus TaxID=2791026 RepID=A0A931FKS3_9BACT|nr:hypothetical protein [Hymenobacter properus]MBF9142020.1 hypothetical protein [Hymenobacter properus]MBR7720827.1 hypothetical protein [Microvirga sp. SRT04]
MRSPFEKPETLPQWLLSSACWAASCWVAFSLFSWGSMWWWKSDDGMFLVFGAAVLVCILMWKRVIKVGWRLWSDNREVLSMNILAGLWLLLQTAAFVLSVLGIAFGTLIWMALSGSSGSNGGGWND